MAKSLYSALFDWMILHVNHAMLNRRDMEESVSVSHFGLPHFAKYNKGRLGVHSSNPFKKKARQSAKRGRCFRD